MSLPVWIKLKVFDRRKYEHLFSILKKNGLNTVCVSADCPNRYDCFSRGTATFMVLGDTCTRKCAYCGVKKGKPEPVNKSEPKRIASTIKKLGLSYAVITCVTRDDLPDMGASIFASTVREIRKKNPDCKVELLTSDLKGDWESLKKIIKSKPDVLGHNIEVVKELFPKMRPKGNYALSIELLRKTKGLDKSLKTKSGLMVGLGENKEQIRQAMKDVKNAGCDFFSIGQYLKPQNSRQEVDKYYSQKEFLELKRFGESLGFLHVESGPLVRSSYMAENYWRED